MKTLLIAMYLSASGQPVPVTYEMTPIACASLMQDVADGYDPRLWLDAINDYSPKLEMAACIEVSE